jgi:hypothetical protein
MLTETLIEEHPTLYHMAEDGSWPSIREHGLLSTSDLLSLYSYRGNEREVIESGWRGSKKVIHCSGMTDAVIRDQKVMPPRDLAPSLTNGMTPNDWYKLINGKVFFWVEPDDLDVFLGATEYRNSPHVVILVKTSRLLELYADRVTLSAINSGSTLGTRRLRGRETFKSISAYRVPWVRELCIEGSIPRILDVAISVDRWIAHVKGDEPRLVERLEILWP